MDIFLEGDMLMASAYIGFAKSKLRMLASRSRKVFSEKYYPDRGVTVEVFPQKRDIRIRVEAGGYLIICYVGDTTGDFSSKRFYTDSGRELGRDEVDHPFSPSGWSLTDDGLYGPSLPIDEDPWNMTYAYNPGGLGIPKSGSGISPKRQGGKSVRYILDGAIEDEGFEAFTWRVYYPSLYDYNFSFVRQVDSLTYAPYSIYGPKPFFARYIKDQLVTMIVPWSGYETTFTWDAYASDNFRDKLPKVHKIWKVAISDGVKTYTEVSDYGGGSGVPTDVAEDAIISAAGYPEGSGDDLVAKVRMLRAKTYNWAGTHMAEPIREETYNLTDGTMTMGTSLHRGMDPANELCYFQDADMELGYLELAEDDLFYYQSDSANNRIGIYDKTTLALVDWFGSFGAGDGEFHSPFGLAVDASYIYIADVFNNRVQVVNKTSPYAFVTKFGTAGTADGQMNLPYSIRVDDTTIQVGDIDRLRVQIFDKTTKAFIDKFGPLGTGDASYTDTLGIGSTISNDVRIPHSIDEEGKQTYVRLQKTSLFSTTNTGLYCGDELVEESGWEDVLKVVGEDSGGPIVLRKTRYRIIHVHSDKDFKAVVYSKTVYVSHSSELIPYKKYLSIVGTTCQIRKTQVRSYTTYHLSVNGVITDITDANDVPYSNYRNEYKLTVQRVAYAGPVIPSIHAYIVTLPWVDCGYDASGTPLDEVNSCVMRCDTNSAKGQLLVGFDVYPVAYRHDLVYDAHNNLTLEFDEGVVAFPPSTDARYPNVRDRKWLLFKKSGELSREITPPQKPDDGGHVNRINGLVFIGA